jgi:hypothetical protein
LDVRTGKTFCTGRENTSRRQESETLHLNPGCKNGTILFVFTNKKHFFSRTQTFSESKNGRNLLDLRIGNTSLDMKILNAFLDASTVLFETLH